MNPRYGAFSHKGKVRELNEDSYLAEGTLFAVADGLGGHQAGEVASSMALEEVEKRLQAKEGDEDHLARIKDSIEAANLRVLKAAANPERQGMATTLTAAVIRGSKLYLGHVGDSRAYLLRDGALRRLTADHSMVQELVNRGKLSSDEADHHPQRNVLTRALGTSPEIDVDLISLSLASGDRVLLATDGLSSSISDDAISSIISKAKDPQGICEELADAANSEGGQDNITVVVVEIPGGE